MTTEPLLCSLHLTLDQFRVLNDATLLGKAESTEDMITQALKLWMDKTDNGDPVDEPWLRENGWLPDGVESNRDFAVRLWGAGEVNSCGTEPAIQLVYSLKDNSAWLETFGIDGETITSAEIGKKTTRGELRQLCKALEVGLKA